MVTDPTIIATALVTIITALTGSVVVIIGALSRAKRELLDAQAEASARLQAIEHHVNGMQTAAMAKRTSDEEVILLLRAQIADQQKTAELLAQAAIKGEKKS